MTAKLTRSLATLVAVILASVFFSGAARADVSLIPHRAEYKVKISLVSGRLNTELRETETGYVAHHVIRPTGLSKLIARGTMDVTSDFAVGKDGVRPQHFIAVDTIRDDPKIDLQFNWDTNQAAGTVGEDHVSLQLDGISFDSVSIQYALMRDLLNEEVAGEYTLFDVDKMRIATVTDAGSKQIETKAGSFTATGVRHQKTGSSRVTTLWCVEELGYLPVVIEQHRKDKLNFRATLLSYAPIPEESTTASSTAELP
jgi:hypothetical protein